MGQIVGTALCIKQLLSVPKLITLEKGKFALSWSGRFILVSVPRLLPQRLAAFLLMKLKSVQVVGTPQSVPTHVIHNQRDFIHRLLSGKFGELSDYFEVTHPTYEEFRSQIGSFCDSQLLAISKNWTELASQPIL